jgi:putative flavoprotein involved in K+ transport
MSNRLDVAVIGAGQAGLAMGYYLSRVGLAFACLDARERVGQSWRDRYDSLRLFTPSQYDALPGKSFPAPEDHYPTKDEVASFLEGYAKQFAIPVQLGVQVQRLTADPGGYLLNTSRGEIRARAVVVATGAYGVPFVPAFAGKLSPHVHQVHSCGYRNPGGLRPGTVLVVGAGNSGLQIASELARSRRVVLARGARQVVFPQRLLGRDIFYWFERLKFTDVPAGSRMGRVFQRNEPIVGEAPEALARRLGLELRPRVIDTDGTFAAFADGSRERIDAVVWATGYRPDYSWIDLPIVGDLGHPIHTAGVSIVPGLFFLGLRWLTGRGSSLLGWVGHDAERLLPAIAAHVQRARCSQDSLPAVA